MEEREWETDKAITLDGYGAMYGNSNASSYYNAGAIMALHQMLCADISPKDFVNKTVLDYGCGTGRVSRTLTYLAKSIDGFDPNEKLINLAKIESKHYTNNNLTFSTNFNELTKDKKYDFVFCIAVLQHLGQPIRDTAIENMKKVTHGNTLFMIWTAKTEVEKYITEWKTLKESGKDGFYTFYGRHLR